MGRERKKIPSGGTCNTSIGEAQVGGSKVKDQPELHHETVQTEKSKNKLYK